MNESIIIITNQLYIFSNLLYIWDFRYEGQYNKYLYLLIKMSYNLQLEYTTQPNLFVNN